MEMPDGTVVPFVGALPAWPENSTTVPLFSPLGTCSIQAACGGDSEMTGLPHAKSSSFSLTNALFFSCFPADERSCGLRGKTGATSWEHVSLKRRKEDFREAMRPQRHHQHPTVVGGLAWLSARVHFLASTRREHAPKQGKRTTSHDSSLPALGQCQQSAVAEQEARSSLRMRLPDHPAQSLLGSIAQRRSRPRPSSRCPSPAAPVRLTRRTCPLSTRFWMR